ncbi:MAG: hypothetical protein O2985_11695 [Proteobacteria bacterium]|nr:hypothetical protein [Pseudomonadota bacterium]
MEDVVKFPGLMTRKRSRNWYYRATVPRGLRDKYDKSQIWISLGTEDRSEAEIAWYEVSARIRDEFDQKRFEREQPFIGPGPRQAARQERLRRARLGADGEPRPRRVLTKPIAAELARDWFHRQLTERTLGKPSDVRNAIDDAQSLLGMLANEDDESTMAATQNAAHELITVNGFAGTVGEPPFDHLTDDMPPNFALYTPTLRGPEKGWYFR